MGSSVELCWDGSPQERIPSHHREWFQTPATKSPESFRFTADGQLIERRIALRSGATVCTCMPVTAEGHKRQVLEERLAALYDREFLRTVERPDLPARGRSVRVVDLFSGCGAMSLGIWEACRAIGRRMKPVLALDSDSTALEVYARNFRGAWTLVKPIESVLDRRLGARPSRWESELVSRMHRIDLVIGGPPCQGHSDLNNHTRRSDPKNGLYEKMARFAELVKPKHLIVENVPAVLHDRGGVVERTVAHLKLLGYHLDHAVVEVGGLGVPQRRKRHVLVASLIRRPNIAAALSSFAQPPRSVAWAVADLMRAKQQGPFDSKGLATQRSLARIDFLFDNDLYELPDAQRPACHRLKPHTYKSVYGRMRWDSAAQTITSGFLSMGQGRFVHPKRRRTITPHEAARLQFIPDFFDFGDVKNRTKLAEMIGNAVPVKLAYVIGIDLLR